MRANREAKHFVRGDNADGEALGFVILRRQLHLLLKLVNGIRI
jgi:hypothetical protein